MRDLLKEAAHSIVTRCAHVKKGFNITIICGRHNRAFAEDLMLECYREYTYPYLWMFDEIVQKSPRCREGCRD